MMRRVALTIPAVAVAARFNATAAVTEKRSKMQTLHKILTGEIAFKNKALVKECNIELQFGAGWKKELQEYAAKLSAEEKKVLDRQVARLSLTRYTTRELAQFGGAGSAGVDAAAVEYNIAQGVAYLQAKGESEFSRYVQVEAKNANWGDDAVKQYVANVKAAAGKK
mmetsp:Transcript_76804/g.89236  ORF Transcript_76804/g.89236 Transcript_76804/m.89236 type:complete len:167 (+) Transcript_76804:45-545(+)|eukprot:CAMPEP_0176466620 /NCGR_PEP_ID=MMETSP0127-20121128/37996_1 /TAXON_ID=938130 /ORGANISM="Platyophrya macrostoma, Strain WH" /LENGTH=166 /DNA_ID=CAMNT_0017859813 /DNA_START=45 /DNA_END=545 /DNA_ORIENTATION=-